MPGLELADSVTVDPHKWFFQAYDIGALVVRRRQDLLDTFHRAPEYYASNRPEDAPLNYYEYSIEGTRRFRALKLWMSWQHLGTEGLGGLVEHNDDLAAYLADDASGGTGLRSRVRTGAVGRVLPPSARRPGGTGRRIDLDAYENALQRALEVDGTGWVSVTTLRGRTYLRAGIVNYLSTRAEVDALIAAPSSTVRRRPRRARPTLSRRA